MTGNQADGGEIKVYIDVASGTLTPTETQWRNFFQQAATKALATAIRQAAVASQNFISASKRSADGKHTLVVFEVASEFVPAIVAVVNAQAAIRGVSGTVPQKGVGVLLAELREAAVDMGLTVLQSQQVTMTVVSWGARDVAIASIQTYLQTNTVVWHG